MAKAGLCFVGEVPTMNGEVSAVRFGCLWGEFVSHDMKVVAIRERAGSAACRDEKEHWR